MGDRCRHLPSGETAVGGEGRRVLEGLLDLQVPGWRDRTLHSRYLPALIVAHDHAGATEARADVPDRQGVWVCGDWVGQQGMLADAAVASALEAARAMLGRRREAA